MLALQKDQGGNAPEGPPPGPWSAAQKASDCTKGSFQRNGTSHPESLGGVSWGVKWPSWFVWRSLCCLLSGGVEGASVMVVLHVLSSEGRGGMVGSRAMPFKCHPLALKHVCTCVPAKLVQHALGGDHLPQLSSQGCVFLPLLGD